MKTSLFILVGYTTKPSPRASELKPLIEAPATYKDPVKIREYIENKTAEFFVKAAGLPYTGELKEIVLAAVGGKLHKFEADAGGSAAAYAASFLRDVCAALIADDGDFDDWPVRLVGFDVRRFVKLLGITAALEGFYVPHGLWYGAEHRDTTEILQPTECKDLPLNKLLNLFTGAGEDYAPGCDPMLDVLVTSEVLDKFNMLGPGKSDWLRSLQPSTKPAKPAKSKKE